MYTLNRLCDNYIYLHKVGKCSHITIYTASKEIKHLGINLIKYVQDLGEENEGTLINKIKEKK